MRWWLVVALALLASSCLNADDTLSECVAVGRCLPADAGVDGGTTEAPSDGGGG